MNFKKQKREGTILLIRFLKCPEALLWKKKFKRGKTGVLTSTKSALLTFCKFVSKTNLLSEYMYPLKERIQSDWTVICADPCLGGHRSVVPCSKWTSKY